MYSTFAKESRRLIGNIGRHGLRAVAKLVRLVVHSMRGVVVVCTHTTEDTESEGKFNHVSVLRHLPECWIIQLIQ